VQEWHDARDAVVRNEARAMVQEEPGKDGHSGRDVGRNRKESLVGGTEEQSGSYVEERRQQPATASEEEAKDRSYVWEV
jgi:hypothetical protein